MAYSPGGTINVAHYFISDTYREGIYAGQRLSEGWLYHRIDDDGGPESRCSLRFGEDGLPRVSFYRENDDLGYAYAKSRLEDRSYEWQRHTPLVVPEDVGKYNALICSGDVSRIAYWDETNGHVRFIWQGDGPFHRWLGLQTVSPNRLELDKGRLSVGGSDLANWVGYYGHDPNVNQERLIVSGVTDEGGIIFDSELPDEGGGWVADIGEFNDMAIDIATGQPVAAYSVTRATGSHYLGYSIRQSDDTWVAEEYWTDSPVLGVGLWLINGLANTPKIVYKTRNQYDQYVLMETGSQDGGSTWSPPPTSPPRGRTDRTRCVEEPAFRGRIHRREQQPFDDSV